MVASAMTGMTMPPDMLANLKPDFVAPFVLVTTHPDGPEALGKVTKLVLDTLPRFDGNEAMVTYSELMTLPPRLR